MGGSSVIEQLRREKDLRQRLETLSDEELLNLAYDWKSWARPTQLAPTWDWATWLVLAGRGFGKTRIGAEQVRQWIKDGYNRVNFIAATADDLRDIMVEGESGILAVCPPDERPTYRVSKRRLEWPNGAISLLFTAAEPERLRGKQHEALWADEIAAWQYAQDAWDQAMFGLRLGRNPRTIATTTPKPTKLIRELIKDPTVAVTKGTTYENKTNLAPTFYSKIIKKYENTRLGRQELNAEVLDDNPGALWKMADIEETRITHDEFKKLELSRIVVAIDPAVTSNEESDETGIIVAGQDFGDNTHYYILEDASGIYTPDGWASKAVLLYHKWEADRIVGEVNNGGDMVETTIRHKDPNVSYKSVHASRGKAVRAEPVSALYEQHRVHHVGTLGTLEDQLINWNPKTDDDSPDRLDADVWALTELAGEWEGWEGLLKHYRGVATAAVEDTKKPEPVPKADGVRPAPESVEAKVPKPLRAYNEMLAKLTPIDACSKCGKPLGSNVSTDGFNSWHPECDKPSWATAD
ncbi:MAG TPA: terminase family protein [Gemmataceae bacterium]|nr:terminase family protein [Gemmataceae bacterium]